MMQQKAIKPIVSPLLYRFAHLLNVSVESSMSLIISKSDGAFYLYLFRREYQITAALWWWTGNPHSIVIGALIVKSMLPLLKGSGSFCCRLPKPLIILQAPVTKFNYLWHNPRYCYSSIPFNILPFINVPLYCCPSPNVLPCTHLPN